MKNTLLFIAILLLLCNCRKEKNLPDTVAQSHQRQISNWYNTVGATPGTHAASLPTSANQMEQTSANESNEFKAMVAIINGMQSVDASYILSQRYYEKAIRLLQHSNADSLKAKAYNGLGSNFKNTGDYPKAFANLFRALKIYEQSHDAAGICSVRKDIGEVYFQKGNIELAKEQVKASLYALRNDKSNEMYLSAAHSLANIYGITGDFKNALAIDAEGIRIADSVQLPKLKVAFLDNKANCFMYSNQLDSAQYYFKECLKIDLSIGNKKQIADSYGNLGALAGLKKEYTTAESLLLKSIGLLKSIDGKPNLEKSYKALIELYMDSRKFQKAAEVQKIRLENYKHMIDEKNEAALASYKIIYETQKKESQIQLLLKESSIRNLKIKQQDYLIAFFVLLLLSFIIGGYFWKSRQRLKNQLLQEKIIRETEAHERNRMARDIHDDLGSGLSKINFLSEIILRKTEHLPEVKSSSAAVKEISKTITENMRDLIWALNPDNNTLLNLVARLREYATDYLADYPITIQYTISETLVDTAINKESYHAIFMVVKETLNNIAKHAQATTVYFSIALTSATFTITISDNGVGFDSTIAGKGNGLQNMKSRLAAIGGVLQLESANGTQVTILIPVAKMNKGSQGST